MSHANSNARKAIDKSIVDLELVPPQIKYMMSNNFQKNKLVDPIQNHDASEVLKETQANIFAIRATIGFERDENGIMNLSNPMIVDMDEALDSDVGSFTVKAHHLEESNLGIVKDNILGTIYNNFKIVRRAQ